MRFTAQVDVDIEDVMQEIGDDVLVSEVENRDLTFLCEGDRTKLTSIYEEFRKRGDAPEVLRDYLYKKLGRTL